MDRPRRDKRRDLLQVNPHQDIFCVRPLGVWKDDRLEEVLDRLAIQQTKSDRRFAQRIEPEQIARVVKHHGLSIHRQKKREVRTLVEAAYRHLVRLKRIISDTKD